MFKFTICSMELIAVILVGILLALGFFLRRPKWQDPRSTLANAVTVRAYEARAGLFVNRSELALFSALIRYRPDGLHVMAKVRLEDILQVRQTVKDGRLRWQYRGRIKSRHVDFVICDSAGRFLCALELDGSSHKSTEAKMLDNFKDDIFRNANLRLFRAKTGEGFDQFSRDFWQQLL